MFSHWKLFTASSWAESNNPIPTSTCLPSHLLSSRVNKGFSWRARGVESTRAQCQRCIRYTHWCAFKPGSRSHWYFGPWFRLQPVCSHQQCGAPSMSSLLETPWPSQLESSGARWPVRAELKILKILSTWGIFMQPRRHTHTPPKHLPVANHSKMYLKATLWAF